MKDTTMKRNRRAIGKVPSYSLLRVWKAAKQRLEYLKLLDKAGFGEYEKLWW